MSKYQLKIKLLSDMCVSDGGVYNSSVDIDICYDAYGFPYIPAKRIRGCLRECAIELQDWGMEIPWQKMFGREGASSHRAAIRIGDAHLEGYEDMRKLAVENEGKTIFHPQNILRHFTYTRTQTAIDYETGVADAASLRTMRVADKGLIFTAEAELDPVYQESLEHCCSVFHNIGVSRTRGLGEIEVSLVEANTKAAADPKTKKIKQEHVSYVDEAEILQYQIFLEEPVICKSVRGGEARTLDYIEGSKMQGLLIENAASRDAFLEIMNSAELFCSNAYIAQDGVRCTEVPAYIYSVKNDSSHYVNKLYPDSVCVEKDGLQLNAMKHCYVSFDEKNKLRRTSVKIEQRYHHRRPEDKSIGRASAEENGNSQFYQMSSMEAGQSFHGYFAGSAEQIRAIYEILSKKEIYYIGYSRSSEYGKIRLQITDMKRKLQKKAVRAKSFYVKLEAPTIVYSSNAVYSADPKDLIEEVNAALGIPDNALDPKDGIRRYVRYTALGGYNTTWNHPKPILSAFDKGTVLQYTLREETELSIPSVLLLGERIAEGYGEAAVQVPEDTETEPRLQEIEEKLAEEDNGYVDAGDPFTYKLCEDLFRDYISVTAAQDADAAESKSRFGLAARPTVSNMILMCDENSKFESIKKACGERYGKNTDSKMKKLGYANQILEKAEEKVKNIQEDFCGRYRIENFVYDEDKQKKIYLDNFLKQLKYNFRQAEQGKGGEEK